MSLLSLYISLTNMSRVIVLMAWYAVTLDADCSVTRKKSNKLVEFQLLESDSEFGKNIEKRALILNPFAGAP